ncbi:hypothetical protein SAMN05216600_12822 [Pseudomonas cuatrocienegasensis]|uniref:Uncharacterized protein n=1 Tax=Pseudomonas cuatrocienegasensis TaxID=543360 RepID=A0ABY1BQW4_9PSED|nr:MULTISPECIES: hypothetical protein [Pseudomonas]OEC32872.1 hypothetical protein A7D25_21755 [Pseudomonas sp. 21C1]SER41053.1 hypothetical protein SAMN05216600_12822 [Pseudomonas cuatrocienegasensis]
MIGDDDFDSFFDPEEFGCTVQLIEPGREARAVNGMWGEPQKSGRLYRSGVDPNAANVRVKPNQASLQLPRDEVPLNWKATKVVTDDAEYSIAAAEPLGRLRTLLTLVPYGNRAAPAGERGKWQASS